MSHLLHLHADVAPLQPRARALTGGPARSPRLVTIDETDAAASGVWRIEQTIDDPEGHHDWRIRGVVDLAASEEEGSAVVRITEVVRL